MLDPLQHRATFFDAYAGTRRRLGAVRVSTSVGSLSPDRAVEVQTDPVGSHVVGPHPTIRQSAVGADVERRQASGEGLGNDQGGIVGGDNHPVGKVDVAGHAASRPIGSYQRDDPGLGRCAAQEVKGEAVDVDVAATVDNDLVPV